jgi:hypothetical protein
MLSDAAHIRMMHVPYKGAANALMDLAGGQIDMMISNYTSIAPQIKSGKVRALAVTSAQPSPVFPQLPTVASAVPGFAADIWVTVFAPAGTPAPVVARLNRELNQIASTPEVMALLAPDGATPWPCRPPSWPSASRTIWPCGARSPPTRRSWPSRPHLSYPWRCAPPAAHETPRAQGPRSRPCA